MLQTILHYISGPVIGAVIGAFTNYLAIKMLFRPLKPVKIGRFTLPLTPGVIPRHQEALADALSNGGSVSWLYVGLAVVATAPAVALFLLLGMGFIGDRDVA